MLNRNNRQGHAGKTEVPTHWKEKPDVAEMFENVVCYIGRI